MIARPYKYILVNGQPEPCEDTLIWARSLKDTTIRGRLRISTVFLGIDHNFTGHGPPVLWETRVFDLQRETRWGRILNWFERLNPRGRALQDAHHYTLRYSSRQDALQGHRECVELFEKFFTG